MGALIIAIFTAGVLTGLILGVITGDRAATTRHREETHYLELKISAARQSALRYSEMVGKARRIALRALTS